MNPALPRSIAAWLLANGWTEPQLIDNTWFAFPPHSVMPIAVPYLARGIDHYTGVLLICLEHGTLRYWLNGGAIVCAQWTPSRQFSLAYVNSHCCIGLDLLEVDDRAVTFRIHPDRIFQIPHGWECQPNKQKGLVIKAVAQSIDYLQEVTAA